MKSARRTALLFFLSALCANLALAQPVIDAVLNAASYNANIAPGCWVAIFGKNLAQQTVSAPSVPLPTTLAGVTVTVGGRPAALQFVSAGQINVLIPFEETTNPAAVVVSTAQGVSAAYNVWLDSQAPALFTVNSKGTGAPLLFDAVTWQPAPVIDTSKPVILLATGLGQTTPPASSTAGGSSIPPYNEIDKSQIKVFIGETPAEVLWAGLMPGFPGIYQINVKPNAPATTRVYLQQGNARSNITDAEITPGDNVVNATATIGPLIPPGFASHQSGPAGFSLVFQGVATSAAFDILPTAKPFVVAAVSESAVLTMRINPTTLSYEGEQVVSTMPPRSGVFTDLGVTVFRLGASGGAICQSVPGNMIPASLLTTTDVAAWRMIPAPNVFESAGIGAAYMKSSGPLPGGSHFSYSGSSQFGVFGGFMQIPCANQFSTKTDTLKFFIDGKLVASKEVTYSLVHR